MSQPAAFTASTSDAGAALFFSPRAKKAMVVRSSRLRHRGASCAATSLSFQRCTVVDDHDAAFTTEGERGERVRRRGGGRLVALEELEFCTGALREPTEVGAALGEFAVVVAVEQVGGVEGGPRLHGNGRAVRLLDADDRRWRDPPPPGPAFRVERLPARRVGARRPGMRSITDASAASSTRRPGSHRAHARHIDHAGTVAHTSADHGAEVLCGAADLADLAAGISPPIRLGQPLNRSSARSCGTTPAARRRPAGWSGGGRGLRRRRHRGHTPGHHSLWRERDRVLIAGDALLAGRLGCAPACSRRRRSISPSPTTAVGRSSDLRSCAPRSSRSGMVRARHGCRPQLSALAAALR